jgi:DNA-binding transcriptional ArsR family regulator
MNVSTRPSTYGVQMASDGWHEVEGSGEPLAEMTITDVALLDEFAHPLRMRLLMLLREPATVAELAGRLGVPTTRLYHHVAHLESVGLVHVVATRKVRSVTEKRFSATALGFRLDPSLASALDAETVHRVIGSMFDITKAELVRAVDNGLDWGPESRTSSALRLEQLLLSTERQRELVERLVAVIEEFEADDEGGDDNAFVMLLAAFPTGTPPHGPQ